MFTAILNEAMAKVDVDMSARIFRSNLSDLEKLNELGYHKLPTLNANQNVGWTCNAKNDDDKFSYLSQNPEAEPE